MKINWDVYTIYIREIYKTDWDKQENTKGYNKNKTIYYF